VIGKQKKKYTIEELGTVYHTTIVEIYKKYTEKAKVLTDQERCNLLKEHKFTIKEPKHGKGGVSNLDKIHQVFDFWPYECAAIRDEKKIKKLKDELKATYTSIKDLVALGDENIALSILKEFREYAHGLVK